MTASALAMMEHARAALRRAHPDVPLIAAISNLPRLEPAMRHADILLSYRYPVPQAHPLVIDTWTIDACRRRVPDRPLWFLSQAIDLGHGARVGLAEPMRPTPAEMRAMAF